MLQVDEEDEWVTISDIIINKSTNFKLGGQILQFNNRKFKNAQEILKFIGSMEAGINMGFSIKRPKEGETIK